MAIPERIKNLHLTGADNRLSGPAGKLTADAGTTVDFAAATVLLPDGSGSGGASLPSTVGRSVGDVLTIATLGPPATFAWTTPATGGGGGGTPGGHALTWASDGDANGVFYYLGTSGTTTWVNPAGGAVTVTGSSYDHGAVSGLTDRTPSDVCTANFANSNFTFGLGSGHYLVVNRWTVRARSDTYTESPTALKLQGSNDSSTWADVDTRTGISVTAASQWLSYPVTGETTGYRYFRVVSTATNSAGRDYFALGEVELYGSLQTAP